MKRFFIACFYGLMALTAQLFAQEVRNGLIVTENGETINAYNIEVSPSTIFYQTSQTADAPICRIAINNVMVIKYADGEKWMPGNDTAAPATQTVAPATANTAVADYSSPETNERVKAAVSPDQVTFAGNHDGKDANIALLMYSPTPQCVMADKNLSVTLRTVNRKTRHYSSRDIELILTNLSDKTVYVDLGNTYFVTGGNSLRYYVPTATSSTHGSSSGASVNLGAVAGAVGIGGAVGTLASGINVGGNSSSANTTTTFSERILNIPPHSSKVLDGAAFILDSSGANSDEAFSVKYGLINLKRDNSIMYKRGDVVTDFGSLAIPSVSAIVNYSLSEDISSPVQLNAVYEADRIICGRKSTLGDMNPTG